MYTLGIDTAGDMAVVSLMDNLKLVSEIYVDYSKNHSVQLMPMIESLFGMTGINKEEIDLISVGKGPGSFTGMRIGLATAKALSYGLGCEIVGVSTLKAMAYPFIDNDNFVLAIHDARNRRIFYGGYCAENVESFDYIIEELRKLDKKITIVGKDNQLFKEALESNNIDYYWKEIILRGQSIARLGVEKQNSGQIDHYNTVLPSYIKLSQAEQNLKK
jgi:tRNA threonylcarbamoyladenosine biosynthesis protein TsaB